MPIFLVEREFAEAFEETADEMQLQSVYEDEHEIRWLTSFLSADKRKSYCLYEADDIELIRRHAADLGLPADAVIEVAEMSRELPT